MPGTDAFKVEGIIVEALANGTCRVELKNGHQLLAYATGKARLRFSPVAGNKVKLELSPYDLSEGRIVVERETKKD
jgi:translation initiation factor IF-1